MLTISETISLSQFGRFYHTKHFLRRTAGDQSRTSDINDVFSITNKTIFIAYADDSLFFVGTDPDNTISTANNVLRALKDWNNLICLTDNAKTEATLFKAGNKEVNRATDIIFNNAKIDFVPEIKTLGVFSTQGLLSKYHVSCVQA